MGKNSYEIPLKVRRFWLAAVGSISLLVLLLSLGADTFYGTNTIDGVYPPITALIGGVFLAYVWARRNSPPKEPEEEPPTGI